MTCLNCNSEVKHQYCGHCGQKHSIKRFTLKEMFNYIIYGFLNVDRGLLFTYKELFTRPGHAVRDYLAGKRVNYFHPFSLLAFSITVSLLFVEYANFRPEELVNDESKEVMNRFLDFVSGYPMLFSLIQVPVYSICSYLFFSKSEFNLAEHLVLNTYRASVDSMFVTLMYIMSINITSTLLVSSITTVISIIYLVWFYYQLFSQCGYKKTGLIARSLIISVLVITAQSIFVAIIVVILNYTA